MTTTETILTRMMNDVDFANAVFADAEQALAGYDYDLSAEDIVKFKSISRAEFDALVANPEDRKSFIRLVNHNESTLTFRK